MTMRPSRVESSSPKDTEASGDPGMDLRNADEPAPFGATNQGESLRMVVAVQQSPFRPQPIERTGMTLMQENGSLPKHDYERCACEHRTIFRAIRFNEPRAASDCRPEHLLLSRLRVFRPRGTGGAFTIVNAEKKRKVENRNWCTAFHYARNFHNGGADLKTAGSRRVLDFMESTVPSPGFCTS